jgi:hypothetical protein
MAGAGRQMDVDEIDAFYAEAKRLQGPPPHWAENSRGELSASWNIEDAIGIVRAHLRFRCSRQHRQFPSVSVIYRGGLVYRLDLVDPSECKFNPLGALALNLPAKVCGPHIHGWDDNREYVRSVGLGHMPYRRPLPAQVRRLPQAMLWLAESINLAVAPDQRGFDVPPQAYLFEA